MSVFFALLVPALTKAAQRMMMKLSPEGLVTSSPMTLKMSFHLSTSDTFGLLPDSVDPAFEN